MFKWISRCFCPRCLNVQLSLPGQNHPPSHRCRSLIVIIAKMIRRGLGTLLMLMLVIHFDICHTMTADRLIKSDWPQWWHVSLNNGISTISSTKPQTGLNAIQEGSNLNDGRRNTTQWSISGPHDDGGCKQLLRGRRSWTAPNSQLSFFLSLAQVDVVNRLHHQDGKFLSSKLLSLVFSFHQEANSSLCWNLAVCDNPSPRRQASP